MIKFKWNPETQVPEIDGDVGHDVSHDIGRDGGVWKSERHFVKDDTPARARLEVAAGRFMRKLGIHETPQHHYAASHGKHFVITDRVPGETLAMNKVPITTSQHRIRDILGAENYLGISDRHGGNYMIHKDHGTVHPIDFGFPFNTRLSPDPYYNALTHKVLDEEEAEKPISHELHRTLKYHLPLLEKYMTLQHGDMGHARYRAIRRLLERGDPPTIGELARPSYKE